jgi:hypothetical protein
MRAASRGALLIAYRRHTGAGRYPQPKLTTLKDWIPAFAE